MRAIRLQTFSLCTGILCAMVLFYQNCGPAKISGEFNHPSQSIINNDNGTGPDKVDLAALKQSLMEDVINVLSPSPFVVSEYEYAQSAPVLENLILRKNDFTKIQWIHAPSLKVVAEGEVFQRQALDAGMFGDYFVFGYRGEKSYLITQFRINEKKTPSLGVGSAGAAKISQQVVDCQGSDEWILVQVEAPAVELRSVEFVFKSTGASIPNRKSILISKKLADSVDIDVKLTDTSGQVIVSPIQLAAKAPKTYEQTTFVHTINEQPAQAGKAIALKPYFLAAPMDKNYSIFIHLVDANGKLILMDQFSPAVPTSQWVGQQDHTVNVTLPSDTAPGKIAVYLGLYENVIPYTNRACMSPGPAVTKDPNGLRYKIGTLNVQ